MHPRQGDVYWTPVDDAGERPVVVVSCDELNRGRTVVIVPFTSARLDRRRHLATCAFFSANSHDFLNKDCVAQADAISRAIVAEIGSPLGRLQDEDIQRVLSAVASVFGLIHWSE